MFFVFFNIIMEPLYSTHWYVEQKKGGMDITTCENTYLSELDF